MAWTKQTFFGIRVPVPKQHVRQVRKELKRRLCAKPGEDPEALAKRAGAALHAMGLAPAPAAPLHMDICHETGSNGRVKPLRSTSAPKQAAVAPKSLIPEANLCSPLKSAIASKGAAQNSTCELAIGNQGAAKSSHCISNVGQEVGAHAAGPTVEISSAPPAGGYQGAAEAKASAIGEEMGAHSGCAGGPAVGNRNPLPDTPWTVHSHQECGFRAKEFLGRGTFGLVYGGILGSNNQAMALKLLPRDPLKPDEDDNKEIAALKRLAHPCIVHLFGVVFTTFNVQLFLQRYEMSLRHYLQRRPSEAQAKQLGQCILRGLAHMHGMGYVHRDLKPGNILVDSQPLAAVISDLGSAHWGKTVVTL